MINQDPLIAVRDEMREHYARNAKPALRTLTKWVGVLDAEIQRREIAQDEAVAWMSPGKERLEFSRPDTVYGSHTIPLYTHPVQHVQPARECRSMG